MTMEKTGTDYVNVYMTLEEAHAFLQEAQQAGATLCTYNVERAPADILTMGVGDGIEIEFPTD